MDLLVLFCFSCLSICSAATRCLDNQHCSDCDSMTGYCTTDCDRGYYDQKCQSVCSKNCRNKTCITSNTGGDNCTDGCVLGYQGFGCYIPCVSPGGSCTACPGGCDGGYCQLGSSCVSGCVDSYYGTDCKICSSGCTSCNRLTGTCYDKSGVGLSVGLATASVLVIVIVVLVVCLCCRHQRRDRFQLYVTPIHDIHAPAENIDDPQYAVVDCAFLSGKQPTLAVLTMNLVHHSNTPRVLVHVDSCERNEINDL